MKNSKTTIQDNLRSEYDLKTLRVRKLGPERKRFGKFVAPGISEQFPDAESLYSHVEDQVITERDLYQITDLFRKFRDNKQKENNPGDAEKAQWEIHYLSFVLREGEIGPQWSQIDENGQEFEYPHLDSFDEEIYKFLATRLDSTNNLKLKAQYAHILWCSPKKHQKFAKIAIDSYLELISVYEKKYNRDRHLFAQEMSGVLINAYSIARQTKDYVEKIKSELTRLLQKFSLSEPFSVRPLIQFMLKPSKGFIKDDFFGLESVCWQIAESFTRDEEAAIDFLMLGEAVDRKLDKQSFNWAQRIAQHYEARMKLFEKAPHAALDFCLKAIENYKKIHDDEKVEELERRYSELRDSMEFGTSRVEVDLTEIVKTCKEWAIEFVKNGNSDDIIQLLISGKNLLPTYQEVEESLKEQIKKSPTLHLLPKVVLDQNVNTAQHFDSEEEKKHFDILSGYELQLRLLNIHLIQEVFFEAILENKLTFDILMDFLKKHCWYGKNLSKNLPNDQTVTYNWLNLIAPALNEYFCQMNFFFANPTANVPNFVLSLDSLTLKIEGLFRELCQLVGVATSRQKKDKSKRNVAQEKDINALLHEDTIKELFDEHDLLFFNFLLVEKWGFNLRHRIAHSLISFQDYNWHFMHLVILAFLRLGKYNFAQSNDAPSDE